MVMGSTRVLRWWFWEVQRQQQRQLQACSTGSRDNRYRERDNGRGSRGGNRGNKGREVKVMAAIGDQNKIFDPGGATM